MDSNGDTAGFVASRFPWLFPVSSCHSCDPSSPGMRGDNECHLCIIKNEWNATSGRLRGALPTGALRTGDAGCSGGCAVAALCHYGMASCDRSLDFSNCSLLFRPSLGFRLVGLASTSKVTDEENQISEN